jgi:hypothetical protein
LRTVLVTSAGSVACLSFTVDDSFFMAEFWCNCTVGNRICCREHCRHRVRWHTVVSQIYMLGMPQKVPSSEGQRSAQHQPALSMDLDTAGVMEISANRTEKRTEK